MQASPSRPWMQNDPFVLFIYVKIVIWTSLDLDTSRGCENKTTHTESNFAWNHTLIVILLGIYENLFLA